MLTDNLGDTCIEDNAINKVEVNYDPSAIRFVAVVYKDKVSVDERKVNLSFKTDSGLIQCKEYIMELTSIYLQHHCTEIFMSSKVVISGIGVKNLCGIAVSKGRNMMVKATVSQKNGLTMSQISAMTDANLALDDCTKVSISGTNKTIILTLNVLAAVNNIVLTIGSGDIPGWALSTESTNGTTIWNGETQVFFGKSFTFFHNDSWSEINKISMQLINSLYDSSYVDICEIEAYGDCGRGKFGLTCKGECSPNCKDKRCNIEGHCLSCASDKFTGTKCCSKYCASGKGCHDNGTCVAGCIEGHHGLDCSKDCSPFCDQDGSCEINSGNCTNGCKAATWGNTCYNKCNVTCGGDKSCDIFNGSCINGCVDGFWGTTCSANCSVNCDRNQSCLMETGDCTYGCKAGFWGTHCLKNCSDRCGGSRSCDINNGDCIEGCKGLHWELQCLLNCSEFCANDGSCYKNGTCVYGCKTGIYGNKCYRRGLQSVNGDWKCHCAEGNCSDEEDMCPTGQCVKGWFAYNCQYIDAGAFAVMPHPSLNDNNDSTCYESHNNSVTARWEEDMDISWVRVVFQDNAKLVHFELQYELLNTMKLCKSAKAIQVPKRNNAYDLDCYVTANVLGITVRWNGNGSLCTFNICHGRNMAYLSSPYVRDLAIRSLIDGDIDVKHYITYDSFTNNKLTLRFPRLVTVTAVTLYTVASFTEVYIELMLIKGENLTQTRFFELINNGPVHHLPFSSATINTIKLQIIEGQIDIREIELNGECYVSTYGLRCEDICRFTCFKNRCTYDGRCFDCLLGRTGSHCETMDNLESDEDGKEANEVSLDDDLTGEETFVEPYMFFILLTVGSAVSAYLLYKICSKYDLLVPMYEME